MDLIYMNDIKEDVGVLPDAVLDLAFGDDENDFECVIDQNSHCCKEDFFLYIEGTEYGGIIDNIGSDADEITYHGRTWHGILNSKVLEPDANANYLVLSGEANSVIATLIERMGLSYLFKASEDDSGITISNYQMNRYIKGYDGIRKMLKSARAKLKIVFENGFVVLSAKPFIDYSKDEQYDKDQIVFKAAKKGNPLNHVICLGKGNLSEREVIHVYADENGNISENQVLTGLAEVTDIYENSSAENSEELRQGGIDMITAAWNSDELEFDFNADEETYDIGDFVGAFENITGINVRTEITKKIVTIANGTVTVSYPSDKSGSGASSSSSGSGGSESSDVYPVGSVVITATNENPASTYGGNWELIDKEFKTQTVTPTYTEGAVKTFASFLAFLSGHSVQFRIDADATSKAITGSQFFFFCLDWRFSII